ncbi:hypothetical protein ACFSTE_12120 [Aquimarina hainanensis]|uniref:Uncharacterized protein n=1 Tax=Aquimarina hainanensis TaxID=1578017 RepID=A0ABW5N9B5_9FLAO
MLLRKLSFITLLFWTFTFCNSPKKIKKENISLQVCDSIHDFEVPEWWGETKIYINDAIIHESTSINDYMTLTRKERETLYNSYEENVENYQKCYLKTRHAYTAIKNEKDENFLSLLCSEIPHHLSVEIWKKKFECEKKSYIAERIADDYFYVCDFDQALQFYKIALQVNEKEKKQETDEKQLHSYDYYRKEIGKKIQKSQSALDEKREVGYVCDFRDTLNELLEHIEDYKNPKRKKAVMSLIKSQYQKDILQAIADKNTDYFYETKSDYEIALCNLLFEDAKKENPLILNKELKNQVIQNFKDFTMTAADFDIGINDVGILNRDKEEWLISFWSSIEDVHGITVVYFKGYEITSVHSVD